MTLATNPPWWVLVGVAVVVIAVAYEAYGRPPVTLSMRTRGLLMTLRLVALTLVAVFLLRPVTSEPAPGPRPVVPVLVDGSESMRLADASGRRAFDRAVALLRDEVTPALGATHDVVPLVFGEGLRPWEADAEPMDYRSDLAGALDAIRDRFDDRTVSGVVVLSDGADTTRHEAGARKGRLGVPVYTVGVGSTPLVDVEVRSLSAGRQTVEASTIDVEVAIVARGYTGPPVEVRLSADGVAVDTRRVELPADAPTRLVFPVAPRRDAPTVYRVEVPVQPGESVAENNAREVLVPPSGRPRRLLMVEGAPGYDHSFLKRVWLADPGFEIDAVVRKGRNDVGEPTFYIQAERERGQALETGFPRRRADLFRYDVVVLANLEVGMLRPEQVEMAEAFVATRGGGLLMLGSLTLTGDGLRGSALEPVVPLELAGRAASRLDGAAPPEVDRVELTRAGLDHPVTRLASTADETGERWRGVPRLGGSVALGPPRPGATVLAAVAAPGGGVRPLLAVQRFGRGRSMVFAGEAAWRWKMRLPATDDFYERFWGQAARWLAASATDPISVDVAGEPEVGDPVDVEIVVRDDDFRPIGDARPEIRVTRPGGVVTTVRAGPVAARDGRYRGSFAAEQAGVHRIDVAVVSAAAEPGGDARMARAWTLVQERGAEWEAPGLDLEVLRRVSETTGGEVLRPPAIARLPELLRRRADPVVTTVTREAWHGSLTFLLLIGVLLTEWVVRRSRGLR